MKTFVTAIVIYGIIGIIALVDAHFKLKKEGKGAKGIFDKFFKKK